MSQLYASYVQSTQGVNENYTQHEDHNLTRVEFLKLYSTKNAHAEIKQTTIKGEPLLYAQFQFGSSDKHSTDAQRNLKGEVWRTAIAAGMYCDTGGTDRDILVYFDSKIPSHRATIARLAGLERIERRVRLPKNALKTASREERVQARRDRLYAQARTDSRKQKRAA